MGLCQVVWVRRGVQGVNPCLSQTLLPSLTWNHFGCPLLFCCPLLSVLSDSELEAVLGFLSSWRVTSVHRWDEKMTIFLPFFHPTLFSGERLREEGNYYMRGLETQLPPLPGLSGRKRIWIQGWTKRNLSSLETAENDPRKTSAAPPPSSSPTCQKVFPTMILACSLGDGGSLKASDSSKHMWTH